MNTDLNHIESKGVTNKPKTTSDHSPMETGVSMDETLLMDVRAVIESNLNNEQFSVEDLAGEVAMSRSHLHRKLSKLTGQSISQFIRDIRLEKAYQLLQKDVGTVSEIAFKVGFGSSTYFIKCFSDSFGFSPGEVKKRTIANSSSSTFETPDKAQSASPVFEQLHPAAAENMIMEIFQEMIRFKPTLEKFLLVDEEEGESVDIRLLAYQIFKNYPWPIGVEVRRLFSIGLQDSSEKRFKQLQKTILRCVRLVAFIMVCEVLKQVEEGQIQLNEQQKKTFNSSLINLSPISLISLLKLSSDLLKETNSEFFESDVKQTFDLPFFRELDDWIGYTENDEQVLEEKCSALEQIVTFLLKKTAFLLRYKLVNVSSISVLKSKFKNPSFKHNLRLLNSGDSDFQLHEEIMEQFSDSNAVLLMKSIKNSRDYLNLSPFVIDTHNELTGSKQTTGLKKDIFLLNSYTNGKIDYLGTEVTDITDLSSLENYNDLCEEFEWMMKILIK